MANRSIRSRVALAGHPLHAMVVHVPIAALLGLGATDLAFVVTGDAFWARASLWLAGVGAAGGWFAAVLGLADLLWVQKIRRLVMAWCHALGAVMMLALASFNWLLRYQDLTGFMPWGWYVTVLTVVVLAGATMLGGHLVYERGVGVNAQQQEGG